MRVLLSAYGPRGDVEPVVRLAVQLRALGAEVRVCAPLDCAERLAEVGRADGAGRPAGARDHVPVGGGRARRAPELVAAQFDTVAAAAEGCDALVATGVMPAGVWL